MKKYENLATYIMNEDITKADDLFHEIVVEKSREIYESLMDMEEMGGDKADELMNDIAVDEEGMNEDDEENMEYSDEEEGMSSEYADDEGMGSEDDGMDYSNIETTHHDTEDLEDRVVDVEDQLAELMAEFDAMMGGDDMEDDMAGDNDDDMNYNSDADIEGDMGMDDEDKPMEGMFNENDSLTKVSKGISNSTEEGTVNKKSVNAVNSGAKGAMAKPHQQVGEETGGSTPAVKPGTGTTSPKQNRVAEPKKKGEGEGVNKKSLNGS